MPNIQIKIKNLPEFQRAMAKAPQIVGRHLQSAVEKAGALFLSESKQNIRTGLDMWKAPIDTGYMWNHIFLNIFPLRAEIYPTADYAVYVHEGTSRMVARPFFDITAQHSERDLADFFADELEKAMTEVARGV